MTRQNHQIIYSGITMGWYVLNHRAFKQCLNVFFCLLHKVINYGSPRGINVHTEKSTQTISKLAILKAQPNDSGNYSCTPSNADAAHIAVHIHNNANPAASIQHGKRSARSVL